MAEFAEHVTFEAIVTNRTRTADGNYFVVPVTVIMLAEPDDTDVSLSLAAFDVVHSTIADPVDGMILSFRMVASTV